jgi:hypothetical protein
MHRSGGVQFRHESYSGASEGGALAVGRALVPGVVVVQPVIQTRSSEARTAGRSKAR